MDIKERIEVAISAGEILEIIYFGGSSPGSIRSIVPVKIDGDKLKARCLKTNVVKTFNLEKISLTYGDVTYTPSQKTLQQLTKQSFQSIAELYTEYKSFFQKSGWYVNYENNNSLSLHSYFKNGNPKRTPDLSIYFDEYSQQMTYEPEKDIFVTERIIKQKPWTVFAKNETLRSYSNISHCIQTFIELSEKYSPNIKSLD